MIRETAMDYWDPPEVGRAPAQQELNIAECVSVLIIAARAVSFVLKSVTRSVTDKTFVIEILKSIVRASHRHNPARVSIVLKDIIILCRSGALLLLKPLRGRNSAGWIDSGMSKL